MGREFVIKTVHLRGTKEPRGKLSRWLNELEEYTYRIEYRPGKLNVVADALSRDETAKMTNLTEDEDWEDKIYVINELKNDEPFKQQLIEEQDNDPVISGVKEMIRNDSKITNSRYYRIRNQLRIENQLLVKSGRWVIPPKLRKFVVEKIHSATHFG